MTRWADTGLGHIDGPRNCWSERWSTFTAMIFALRETSSDYRARKGAVWRLMA